MMVISDTSVVSNLLIVVLVGILIRAKEQGATPAIKPLLDRVIQEAGFYLSPRFYQQILSDQGEGSDS